MAERSDAKVGRDLAIELAAAKAAATSLENSLAASLAAAEAAKAQAREAQHQASRCLAAAVRNELRFFLLVLEQDTHKMRWQTE